jgi:hypothetical protein
MIWSARLLLRRDIRTPATAGTKAVMSPNVSDCRGAILARVSRRLTGKFFLPQVAFPFEQLTT